MKKTMAEHIEAARQLSAPVTVFVTKISDKLEGSEFAAPLLAAFPCCNGHQINLIKLIDDFDQNEIDLFNNILA